MRARRIGATLVGVVVAGLLAAAPSSGTAWAAPSTATASRPAIPALAVTVPEDRVLTLPAGDGFRDALHVTVVARAAGTIDVRVTRGTRRILVAHDVRLHQLGDRYLADARVGVRGLTAGTWTVGVVQHGSAPATAHAVRPVVVGSGAVRTVTVTPASRIVYPFADGRFDDVTSTVTALDETGTVLPAAGTVRLTSGARIRTVPVRGSRARLDASGMPTGAGLLVARMTGPAGLPRSSGALHIALRATAVASVALATSASLVEPVIDDVADTVAITARATMTLPGAVPVVGTITVTGPGGVVRTWPMSTGAGRTVTWDGRVAGRVVPGTYLVTVSARGPQGAAVSRSTALTVSADHLPYRARMLFTLPPGNQQGLAVHDGTFFVATDLGDGTSRIDEYDATGASTGHLGPLPIGHGAELTYSAASNLLYAVNGGMTTATRVLAIDPTSGTIVGSTDLAALGANGMVAVDDATGRLLVFAGSPGAYTVSVVDPQAGTVLATDPVQVDGLPQGIDLVHGELWIYTSLASGNRITRFTVAGADAQTAFAPVPDPSGTITLAALGEGEGLASAAGPDAAVDASGVPSGSVYVGAHHSNRIAVIEAVPDE